VLNYLPQTDKPQVTYIKPRHTSANLWIDRHYLETRKAVYQKKLEAMLNYCETDRCRSQQLLAYFNEPNAPKCGVCDVCLREKRKQNVGQMEGLITNEVLQLLSTAPLSLEQLVTALKNGKSAERINVIRQLLDSGRVKTNGDKYYL